MQLFQAEETGDKISKLIDVKWSVFAEKVSNRKNELLLDIANGFRSEPARNIVNEPSRFRSDLVLDQSSELWRQFSGSIESINRFFYPEELDLGSRLVPSLQLIEKEIKKESIYFRARICTSEERAFPANKMGAPPNHKSTAGRANPAGIAYLYLADKINTAVHEVRPSTLDLVSIAKFKTVSDLRVIDLRKISPFQFSKAEDFEKQVSEIPLLNSIGEHLAKPIHSSTANVKYAPTQYLSELLKFNGWDGVLYKSALNQEGYNLALFNPESAECIKVLELHSVSKVNVIYTP
ncbi:MAG: RES family NAD+ phosphorylase [Candidatus Electryonea clarkiae]|nr:RES family NAD+ phosphorylase [Candidatus Electryonea clarkiae]MDP8288829.1 RES family NAD+ phosphorylase [Candidatus Electryonea clarkiae]